MEVRDKIEALRKCMAEHNLAAYIIPTDDFHGSEYVGDYFKAREFMSGFTGSAGTLLVTMQEALLWTDGRYFLQAESQLKDTGITLMRAGKPGVLKLNEYLKETLQENQRIGFDGRTVSAHFVEMLEKEMAQKKIGVDGDNDLVDIIWEARPKRSAKMIWELPLEYAGKSREEKLCKLKEEMEEEHADCMLITALDEIAWLLNLRGDDVLYTPVFLSYLLISQKETTLFVQQSALCEEIRKKLNAVNVKIADYEQIEKVLCTLADSSRIWLDEKRVNYRLVSCIPKSVQVLKKETPIEGMKAVKNEVEAKHAVNAHIKDGVAVTKFIYWLKTHVGKEEITEIGAAQKLLAYRKQMDGFLDQSFEPIIAYGAHGAIIHYAATKETDVLLKAEGLCLADTGAHYLEGTTDITRTIALGRLTEDEKKAFTLVLRGHLNLASAYFLKGVCGQNLDYLARAPLWEHHMDFNHGTGHGVGYVLGVHEGPQRIHWRITKESSCIPFEEGMITSDEPGFYLPGKFGIRHENLLLCKNAAKTEYGQFMHFETLTLVPFDVDAIDVSLMQQKEVAQLNAYHKKVYETLVPFMDAQEKVWLERVTAPIGNDIEKND